MASHDGKHFSPRKWYRRVPFLSITPIELRLTADETSSTPSRSNAEDQNDFRAQGRTELPELNANWLSILTFNWLSRLLKTGYTRPLQADDLYSMPGHRLAEDHADRLEAAWSERLRRHITPSPADTSRLLSWGAFWLRSKTTKTTLLTLALNDICFSWFWLGGLLKLIGDLSQMVAPLLIRFLIATLSDSSQQALRSGFGYAVGLFILLVISVTSNVHGFYRSYTTGVLMRGALMHAIYRRTTTQLTNKAKLKYGLDTGSLMSLISADVTRVDYCCGFFHVAWISIFQVFLCFALTLWTMGYSALPGFGLLVLLFPLQSFMMRQLLRLRRGSMPFTDARVKAVVQSVAAIYLVKTNAYEQSLLSKIKGLRADEVVYIRKRMLLRALNTAISYTAPTLASVVSIVCYGATSKNGMDASIVFSSLAFFMMLRTPLQALPTALSAIADARAALERLADFMSVSEAESKPVKGRRPRMDPADETSDSDTVIRVEDATFAYPDDEELMADYGPKSAEHFQSKKCEGTVPTSQGQRLWLDSLVVRRNQLVCIVGAVASGKSSVLRALLGDMEMIKAQSCRLNLAKSSSASSQLALAPQTAWLLSETVRENIVFRRPLDIAWYDEVLTRCCLHQDLGTLPDGDMTVVGENGVSLSGGQKQRISLARAIYGRSSLLLLDDCFSALDAHVGRQVFDMAINRARRNNEGTIVMITHTMNLVRQADHVIYMENGRILEQGPFEVLYGRGGAFTAFAGTGLLVQELNPDSETTGSSQESLGAGENSIEAALSQSQPDPQASKDRLKSQSRGYAMMQAEERLVGPVNGRTYIRYMQFGNAWLTLPLLLLSIVIYQGTSIVSPLWLSWWQDSKYASISQSAYMGGYAAFGIGQSLGLFCMSATFALFCFWCSNKLHHAAISKVLLAPVAFFNTTPQGRITHRFSKDVDAVDNVVGETLRLFISTFVQVLGTIIVVSIIVPAFLAIAAALLLVYTWTGMYYRPSSRELRRLTNLLRSPIYEHFSESLSGLSTIKAFGCLPHFVSDNARKIDTENTAYWLSVACQRWLNLRLDLCGATLVLAAGLLVVGLRDTINPSSGGVVLSYMVTAQAVFGNMIRQSAEIENNMNSVERMLHYAFNIEQEPAHKVTSVDKALVFRQWPSAGHIEFQSLTLSHRPDLKPALKGITLSIKPGQKVGIIGRTGAGKSTLISALLRIVEPTSGRVRIDGVDIHTIGLHLLRSSLSVISQDAMLLPGTIRYNLDPFQQYKDAWLLQCLNRVGLGDEEGWTSQEKQRRVEVSSPSGLEGGSGFKLGLNFEVSENGGNISQGQRSLISIARALVRKSKIIILDEATASIDARLDARLQGMLVDVVEDATVLVIAHRLDTVIATCDKVLVMENGRMVEFDSVPDLYHKMDSKFRLLCDAAGVRL